VLKVVVLERDGEAWHLDQNYLLENFSVALESFNRLLLLPKKLLGIGIIPDRQLKLLLQQVRVPNIQIIAPKQVRVDFLSEGEFEW
jgi:hypothetical protein